MSIVRAPRKSRGFTIIDNDIIEDGGLSMKATGLLAYILTRPDNWRCNSASIAVHFGCGKEAVRSAMKELSEAGFARLVKKQDPATGLFSSEWYVFESKVKPSQETPTTDYPRPENPVPGDPDSGSFGSITRTEKQELNPLPLTQKSPWPPRKSGGTLLEFLAHIKEIGQKAIRDDDPIFEWGQQQELPHAFLQLAWIAFKDKYLDKVNRKTQRTHEQLDWRAAFRTEVKRGWLNVWMPDRMRGDGWKLTTFGEQLRREHGIDIEEDV